MNSACICSTHPVCPIHGVSKDMRYLVELEQGTYLAPWAGDPGRTIKRSNAKRYKSEQLASIALRKARRYRPFVCAKINAVID